MSEGVSGPRDTATLPRPPGPPPAAPALYEIHAADKGVVKAWRDLCVSHAGNARRYYDYLSQAPLQRDAERVFPLKGKKLEGIWECEVGGGARLFYMVDEARKRVIIREISIAHP